MSHTTALFVDAPVPHTVPSVNRRDRVRYRRVDEQRGGVRHRTEAELRTGVRLRIAVPIRATRSG
ncbi:MAG: hypothetical protein AAF726_15455, partial [Planctomycetota bacterium]